MSSRAINFANKYVQKTGNKEAIMSFSVDDPRAFANECDIEFIAQKAFFSEARQCLKKNLKIYTRIAMKILDEGKRKGYILQYRF